MDLEDWRYIVGVVLVSAGAGLFHYGAGLAIAGAMIAFPSIITMIRMGKGPPEKK